MPLLPPFRGPFLGINDLVDPARVDQRYATVARNILLSEGAIRIRAPLALVPKSVADAVFPQPIIALFEWIPPRLAISGFKVLSQKLIVCSSGAFGVSDASGSGLYVINRKRDNTTKAVSVEDATRLLIQASNGGFGDSQGTVNFMRFGDWVYMSLSNQLAVYKTDGVGLWEAGITYPSFYRRVTGDLYDSTTARDVEMQSFAARPPTTQPAGTKLVDYRVTFYDSETGVESNSDGGDPGSGVIGGTAGYVADPGISTTFYIVSSPSGGLFFSAASRAQYKISHVRIYRRNISLGQVAWQLIKQLPYSVQGWSDNIPVSSIAAADAALAGVSDSINGPFCPAKNAQPRGISCMANWQNRMFYAKQPSLQSPTTPVNGRLFYSALSFPDHADLSDFVQTAPAGDDQIRGMAVGIDLTVAKRRAFHLFSGLVRGATNQTIATGLLPAESELVARDIIGLDGPINEFGNGTILAGKPAVNYFVGDAGICVFDGLNVRVLSRPIAETMRRLLKPATFLAPNYPSGAVPVNPATLIAISPAKEFTFAEDRDEGVLYICPRYSDVNNLGWFGVGAGGTEVGNLILCYHYRLDRNQGISGWTVYDAGGRTITELGAVGTTVAAPRCIASTVAYEQAGTDPATLDFREPGILIGADYGLLLRSVRTSLYAAGGEADADNLRVPDFTYSTGKIPIHDGLQTVLRFLRFLLTDSRRNAGVANAVTVTVQVGSQIVTAAKDMYAGTNPAFIVPVKRRGNDVQWTLSRAAGFTVGWSDRVGVRGWELSAEPVGT